MLLDETAANSNLMLSATDLRASSLCGLRIEPPNQTFPCVARAHTPSDLRCRNLDAEAAPPPNHPWFCGTWADDDAIQQKGIIKKA